MLKLEERVHTQQKFETTTVQDSIISEVKK